MNPWFEELRRIVAEEPDVTGPLDAWRERSNAAARLRALDVWRERWVNVCSCDVSVDKYALNMATDATALEALIDHHKMKVQAHLGYAVGSRVPVREIVDEPCRHYDERRFRGDVAVLLDEPRIGGVHEANDVTPKQK